jgi:patatin-related protein
MTAPSESDSAADSAPSSRDVDPADREVATADSGDDAPALRERELRLALVCYGGVSLAVYMHGVTREILKLIRASRAYNAVPEADRKRARYVEHDDSEVDSEHVYFELLQTIGHDVALRIIVDVIAGASAGGINGVMLARALAFDLSLDAHRGLWLDLADVAELLDPAARAGQWSKPFMRPLFWAAAWQRRRRQQRGRATDDPEVIANVSLFMRSRWFEPPFSGERMSEMMLDALLQMGESKNPADSLLPPGLPLDLFVTTTEFWGYQQSIALHDPKVVNEREHRHIFRFQHLHQMSGKFTSNMTAEHIPSLAFAARASSSFPGAFPPAQLSEMDTVTARRGLPWGGRESFVRDQFAALRKAGEDPERAAFIDGSVLMNKPISLALRAIQSHVAHRETDRRLVFLEPSPDIADEQERSMPGFFTTLKGAVSDIPRNQPIRDDLEWIAQFNEQVRLQRQVIDSIRPQVIRTIGETLGDQLSVPPDAAQLGRWRASANKLAAVDAGYTYEGYSRLKVLSLLADLAELMQAAAGFPPGLETTEIVQSWARRKAIRPMGDTAAAARWGVEMPWIDFLQRFDVRHRIRRILFLIRRANELYMEATSARGRRWLDQTKIELYRITEVLRLLQQWPESAAMASGGAIDDAKIDVMMDAVAAQFALAEVDADVDALLARVAARCPDTLLARELIIAYLGFAYYDVLTHPMAQSRDLHALDEIKVDRISADDANTLHSGTAHDLLKGVEMGKFGAFFSRTFRENDYLWGRLIGAERLVDIVVSAVPEAVAAGLDVTAFKRRLFLAILDAEAAQLPNIHDLIADLRELAERL